MIQDMTVYCKCKYTQQILLKILLYVNQESYTHKKLKIATSSS